MITAVQVLQSCLSKKPTESHEKKAVLEVVGDKMKKIICF